MPTWNLDFPIWISVKILTTPTGLEQSNLAENAVKKSSVETILIMGHSRLADCVEKRTFQKKVSGRACEYYQ
jgi:hypothetical protein